LKLHLILISFTKMMTMENQMEPLCVICLETFNQSRKALSLTCGHSYCIMCSKQMINQNRICCPECRKETKVKSVNDLTTNISLMRICLDSEDVSQHNMIVKNIKQLREIISHKSAKRIEVFELYISRLCNHSISLNSVLSETESFKTRLQFIQQFKEIDTTDLKGLNRVIKQQQDTLAYYKSQADRLNEGVKRVKVLEENSKFNTLLIDLDKILKEILTIETVYLKPEDKQKIDQQLKANNEIANTIKQFEKKYSPSLSDLKSKENVKLNDIVDGLEWDMKFSKFRIGFVGNSGNCYCYLMY